MRLIVTGKTGQVVRALVEQSAAQHNDVEVICLGRPELDLGQISDLDQTIALLKPLHANIVISAAAYTAVDAAEGAFGEAFCINARGAGLMAAAARELGLPIVHLSTDYVFDGKKALAYVESDPVHPLNAYGMTKLAGEVAVASAHADHAILRTTWVYDAFGKNFVSTMLRLGAIRDEMRVVGDQIGAPTYAPDIAGAVIGVARNLVGSKEPALRGVFHMAGAGETSWAGFAEAIFALEAERCGKQTKVVPITAADYPTPAARPSNSRLNCDRLARTHKIRLPQWQDGLQRCFALLSEKGCLK